MRAGKRSGMLGFVLVCALVLGACAPKITKTNIIVPEAIPDNSGKFMCPFTSDGVIAPWMEKAYAARFGAAVGKAVAQIAVREGLKQAAGFVPIPGLDIVAAKAGEAAGREIAIKMCGGREYIRNTSDLSFNNVDDLGVYIFANYSDRPDYAKVLKLTWGIYPKLQQRYPKALNKAHKAWKKQHPGEK